ncbi:MAG: nitroreductase family protein [Fretibacterium sp.]|nr:nitroreductase family protein [Fretibacterium sp.]
MSQEFFPDHKVADFISRRWSPHAFDENNRVTKEQMMSLLEAARWAPSAYNEQPWRFLVAVKEGDEKVFDEMLDCLMDLNQAWAFRASALLILLVRRRFAHNGKENPWAEHDCGLALENLMLQAFAQGLVTHPMTGFYAEKVKERYNLPQDCEPLVAVAVGYLGSPELLSGDKKRLELEPRERRPVADFAAFVPDRLKG